MAGDTFSIDPKSVEAAAAVAASSEKVKSAMGQTRDFTSEIKTAMQDVANSATAIEENAEKLHLGEDFVRGVREVKKDTLATGSALLGIVQGHAKVAKALKDQERLEKEGSKRRRADKALLQEIKKLNEQISEAAKKKAQLEEDTAAQSAADSLERKKNDEEKKRDQSYINRQTREVSDTLAGMAGLSGIIVRNDKSWELSLSAVLKKIVDIYNKSEKIEGYSVQTAAQFKSFDMHTRSGASAMRVATAAALDLRAKFGMGFEEAGKITSALAQAGFEAEDMGKWVKNAKGEMSFTHGVASRMLGVQQAQGREVSAQIESIMMLRNNFTMMVNSAQTLDALIGDIGRQIPGLSPQQAVADVEAMSKGMRYFNMEILDSLTLYKSLQSDAENYRKSLEASQKHAEEMSKKLGYKVEPRAPEITSAWGELVKAPLEQRKDLMQWMSSAPMQLGWGAQSMLGQGRTPTAAIGDFFKAMQGENGKNAGFEFLKRVMEKVTVLTQGQAGDKDARRLAITEILTKQFAVPNKELAMRLADQVVEGQMNTASLQKLGADLEKNRAKLEAEANKREKLADNVMRVGSSIAQNLLTLEQTMANFVDDYLMKPMMEIKAAMRELGSSLRWLSITEEENLFYKKIENLPEEEKKKALAEKEKYDSMAEAQGWRRGGAGFSQSWSDFAENPSLETGLTALSNSIVAGFGGGIIAKFAIQNEAKSAAYKKIVDERLSHLENARKNNATAQAASERAAEADQRELARKEQENALKASKRQQEAEQVKGGSPLAKVSRQKDAGVKSNGNT